MHINELIRKNKEKLEKHGAREVAPGVYRIPFDSSPEARKRFEKFNEEYGAAVDKAIARKDYLKREAEAKIRKEGGFIITY